MLLHRLLYSLNRHSPWKAWSSLSLVKNGLRTKNVQSPTNNTNHLNTSKVVILHWLWKRKCFQNSRPDDQLIWSCATHLHVRGPKGHFPVNYFPFSEQCRLPLNRTFEVRKNVWWANINWRVDLDVQFEMLDTIGSGGSVKFFTCNQWIVTKRQW